MNDAERKAFDATMDDLFPPPYKIIVFDRRDFEKVWQRAVDYAHPILDKLNAWLDARKDYLSLDWNRKDPAEFGRRQSRMQTAMRELEQQVAGQSNRGEVA